MAFKDAKITTEILEKKEKRLNQELLSQRKTIDNTEKLLEVTSAQLFGTECCQKKGRKGVSSRSEQVERERKLLLSLAADKSAEIDQLRLALKKANSGLSEQATSFRERASFFANS